MRRGDAVFRQIVRDELAAGLVIGPYGLGFFEDPEAIIQIAVSGMYSDVSSLVSRFGVDPREFSLLAFGGAGPMMACFLARELRMTERGMRKLLQRARTRQKANAPAAVYDPHARAPQ